MTLYILCIYTCCHISYKHHIKYNIQYIIFNYFQQSFLSCFFKFVLSFSMKEYVIIQALHIIQYLLFNQFLLKPRQFLLCY